MEVSSCPTLPFSWVSNCPVSKCPVSSCPVSSCPGFAWTSPCNPDPLKPGVKLMAGRNSAGVGVTSVSLPVVNSYVSKTCDKKLRV